jgi:hypothetical protein
MNFGGYPFLTNALEIASFFFKVSSFVHIAVTLLCRHLTTPCVVLYGLSEV